MPFEAFGRQLQGKCTVSVGDALLGVKDLRIGHINFNESMFV